MLAVDICRRWHPRNARSIPARRAATLLMPCCCPACGSTVDLSINGASAPLKVDASAGPQLHPSCGDVCLDLHALAAVCGKEAAVTCPEGGSHGNLLPHGRRWTPSASASPVRRTVMTSPTFPGTMRDRPKSYSMFCTCSRICSTSTFISTEIAVSSMAGDLLPSVFASR